jgi:hypothetical protein
MHPGVDERRALVADQELIELKSNPSDWMVVEIR